MVRARRYAPVRAGETTTRASSVFLLPEDLPAPVIHSPRRPERAGAAPPDSWAYSSGMVRKPLFFLMRSMQRFRAMVKIQVLAPAWRES